MTWGAVGVRLLIYIYIYTHVPTHHAIGAPLLAQLYACILTILKECVLRTCLNTCYILAWTRVRMHKICSMQEPTCMNTFTHAWKHAKEYQRTNGLLGCFFWINMMRMQTSTDSPLFPFFLAACMNMGWGLHAYAAHKCAHLLWLAKQNWELRNVYNGCLYQFTTGPPSHLGWNKIQLFPVKHVYQLFLMSLELHIRIRPSKSSLRSGLGHKSVLSVCV